MRIKASIAAVAVLTALGAGLLAFDAAFAQVQPPPGFYQSYPQYQPQPQRRGLLDLLFGPRQQTPSAPRSQSSAPRRPAASVPAPAITVEPVPKDPDARQILLVGDFVAGGLASGLEQSFAEEAKLAVVDRSNANSGIVRDDYYDWGARLPEILQELKPDIVVMVIGSNDRQQVTIAGTRLQPRTEPWDKVYAERIDGLVRTLRTSGRPFFWVSAPPMPSTSASRDMAYFNELYKARVTAAGGHYVDVWDGFTDENGRFITSGPDVDGQRRALRSNDGVNFTRAGRLKLAFYVEREMRSQTGIGAGSIDLLAAVGQPGHVEIGPDGTQRLVGPVISLADPLPGASAELAGTIQPIDVGLRIRPDTEVFGVQDPFASAPVGAARSSGARVSEDELVEPLLAAPSDAGSAQYMLIVKGTSLPAVPARADDFTWPPPRVTVPMQQPVPAPVADAAPLATPVAPDGDPEGAVN
jgi:hypothetical protein